jgi:nucleotide-binding universal stress UspA family protein
MIKRIILVGTDFSDPSKAALDWGIELAQALGARLTLANVFDLPIVGLPDASLVVGAKEASRLLDAAQAAVDAEVGRAKDRGVAVEGIVRQGDPREVLPHLAVEMDVGLLIVGSHGRRGIMRALIGSVAESIARTSKVPVAVIHGHAVRTEPPS